KGHVQRHTGVRLRLLLVHNALNQQSAIGIYGRVNIVQQHPRSSSKAGRGNLLASGSHGRASLDGGSLVHRNRNRGELVSGQNLNSSADRSLGKNHPYLSFLKIVFQALVCALEGIRSLLAQLLGKLNSGVFLLVISTSAIRLRVLL